jgi:16S rRNA (guanine(966)-N(2))-methyltransferase RsmD
MSGIRIIAGEFRGRDIKSFKNDLSIRPLLGRIKKSLFDILRPRLADCDFLDLYAGVGSVGIEALSRGAKYAAFVDLDRKSVKLIKENLDKLGVQGRSDVYGMDALKALSFIKDRFDIVFLGPPYKDSEKKPLFLTSPTLEAISNSGVLKEKGLVVSQHHIKEPVAVPNRLKPVRREVYGDTVISFYANKLF